MVSPSHVSTTASASPSANSWSNRHVVTLPPLRAPGDHMLLSFGIDGGGGDISLPDNDASWVQVLSVDLNSNQKWRAWVRQVTGAEEDTVTVYGTKFNTFGAQVLLLRAGRAGVVEGTAWDVEVAATRRWNTTPEPPAVTPTWGSADQLYVAMFWAGALSPSVESYPGSYSNGAEAGAVLKVGSASRAISASSSTDPGVFILTNSTNNVAATFVLRPAATITAGAQVATGTGSGHDATCTPPTTRVAAQVATATGEAHWVKVPPVPVPSDIKIEWDLDNDGNYDEDEEDITGYVQALSLRRGRDFPSAVTGQVIPGELRMTLDNTDNRFSLFNADSPLNAGDFSLRLNRRIRIRTTESAPVEPLQLARDSFAGNGDLSTDGQGNAWTTTTGSGFGSWRAYRGTALAQGPPDVVDGRRHVSVVDIEANTYYAQVAIGRCDPGVIQGLVFHYGDDENYAVCFYGQGTSNFYARLGFFEVVAGVQTTLVSEIVEARDGITLGIRVNGDAATAFVDGVEAMTVTTTVGDGLVSGDVVYYNNFSTGGTGAASGILGSEWELYNADPGNGGFGIRSDSQLEIVTEGTSTDGGNVIRLTAEDVGGEHYHAGMKLKLPQTYGTYEFRVRTSGDASEVTSGLAILWPGNDTWPEYGEVDLIESFDNRDTRTPLQFFIHRLNPAAVPPYDASDDQVHPVVEHEDPYSSTPLDGTAWHKFVFRWTPDQITVQIDDHPDERVLIDEPAWIPDWPMELTFQLDAWSDTPPATPVTMDVDYVLVRTASTRKVGIFGQWWAQRPPELADFGVWDRMTLEEDQAGVLATCRVVSVRPAVTSAGERYAELVAKGDLAILNRPITPPRSVGPIVDDSFLGSYEDRPGIRAGHVIGGCLSRVGMLHPPGPIEAGLTALGSVGLGTMRALTAMQRAEATEQGVIRELRGGGVAFEGRGTRDAGTTSYTFTDDSAVQGYRMERLGFLDWQGSIVNRISSEVSPLAPSEYLTFSSGTTQQIEYTFLEGFAEAFVGKLVLIFITTTLKDATVEWLTPAGWTMLRMNGNDYGHRLYAKHFTASDVGGKVEFYQSTDPQPSYIDLHIINNAYSSVAGGVAVSEYHGYGEPHTGDEANRGQNDPPVLFTPWQLGPTMFYAIRAGMVGTGSPSVQFGGTFLGLMDVMPHGFNAAGSWLEDFLISSPADMLAQQVGVRTRTEDIVNPTPFGGIFTGFEHVETAVVAVRGYAGDPAPANGGQIVTSDNAASQATHGAILDHPNPGTLYSTVDDAEAMNDYVLRRWSTDRPILSLAFTATRDARHRELAAALEISDVVRVDANGPRGLGIDETFFVESIAHEFDMGNSRWVCEVELSPTALAVLGADGFASTTGFASAGAATGTGGAHDADPDVPAPSFALYHESTGSGDSTGTTSHTVSYPATVNAGDLLVLSLMFNSDTTVTVAAGWTRLATNTGSPGTLEVWARIAGGTEDGTTFSVTTSTTLAGAFLMRRYSNTNGGVTLGTHLSISSSAGFANATSSDAPSVTAGWGSASNTFVVLGGARGDNVPASSAPSSFGNLVSAVSTNGGGGGASTFSADRQMAATATHDPDSITLGSSQRINTYTLVIRPA